MSFCSKPTCHAPRFYEATKPSDIDENSEIANIEEETDIKILDLDQDVENIK